MPAEALAHDHLLHVEIEGIMREIGDPFLAPWWVQDDDDSGRSHRTQELFTVTSFFYSTFSGRWIIYGRPVFALKDYDDDFDCSWYIHQVTFL